ncbi:MAG: EF-P lysine aminoacylase EpmA [Granulosicoccaceae bacterium]
MTGDWRPTASAEARTARGAMMSRLREYFYNAGVLEVDTPTFSSATSPDPHVPSFEANNAGQFGYLHTSPEYPMKRLLAAGSGDIYQIAKVFRAGERGAYHNPEFTLLEWYRVGFELSALMQDVHRVVAAALNQPVQAIQLSFRQASIDLGGFDPWTDSSAHLRDCLVSAGHSVPESLGLEETDGWIDLAFSQLVASQFPRDRLTFVEGYPPSQAALARVEHVGEVAVASRFEAYWSGLELANGFHELVDPVEQRARFEAERAAAKLSDLPQRPVDERFLEALQTGLPDCSGVAIGVDRLLMVLLQVDNISEVLNFPVDRA